MQLDGDSRIYRNGCPTEKINNGLNKQLEAIAIGIPLEQYWLKFTLSCNGSIDAI